MMTTDEYYLQQDLIQVLPLGLGKGASLLYLSISIESGIWIP